jgi:two-component system NtrC family response regulator
MRRPRILLLDGDDGARESLREGLEARGLDVATAATSAECLVQVRAFVPDVLLAAAASPRGDDVVAAIRALPGLGSDAAVVAIAPVAAVEAAVASMRAGAQSYLLRPAEPAQVALVVEKALETRRLQRERAALREQVRRRHVLVGGSPEVEAVREVVRRAGPTKATVLVAGESGSGRELVAHVLHEASPRRERPFVRVSCAALSQTLLEAELFGHEAGAFGDLPHRREGRIVAADGGTLFLHEVAQLPQAVQVRLLRVLQHGELERVGGSDTLRVDVRVVAATSRDLAAEVAAGRFRDDLYYRLSVVSLALPPLRQRKTDIPALVGHLLARSPRAAEKDVRTLSPGALSALFAYDWPGNVRELENVTDAAVALCEGGEIGAEHLSPVLHGSAAPSPASALIPGATLFEIEREAILRTLDQVGGSTARAAEVLGISVRKIQYRLKEYKGALAGRARRALADVG